MICLSLSEKYISDLYNKIKEFYNLSDLFEIRLDYLEEINYRELKKLKIKTSKPFIFTNRKKEEGGKFLGAEEQRIEILARALDCSPEYVDIELNTQIEIRDSFIKKASATGSNILVSYHNFERTPSIAELEKTLLNIKATFCDYAKIVTTAESKDDIKKLFNLYFIHKSEKPKLIAFCMGNIGKISRVSCLAMGAPFTYAAQTENKETAPGQIAIIKLKNILDVLEVK